MLSRRAVSETVERVLDLKPVRDTMSGVRRIREVKWAKRLRDARERRRTLLARLGGKTWLREPGHYRSLVLDPEQELARANLKCKGADSTTLARSSADVDPERRRALFYAVMAGLREYYYPWSEFTGRDIPFRDIIEAAGVIVRPFDDRETKGDAVSTWHPVPTIEIHPELLDKGSYSHALMHELHHLMAPYGDGQHREDVNHVNEVLAGRFSREVLCPLPATVHHATQSSMLRFAGLAHTSVHLENILRIVDRQALTVTFVLANDWQAGHTPIGSVVTQCRSGTSPHGDSLDDLMLLASRSRLDQTTNATWGTGLSYGSHCLSRDGIYHALSADAEWWQEWWEEDQSGANPLSQIETRPGRIGAFSRLCPSDGMTDIVFSFEGAILIRADSDDAQDDDACERDEEKITRYSSLPSRSVIVLRDTNGSLTEHFERGRRRDYLSVLPPDEELNLVPPRSFDEWVDIMERAFLDGPPRTRLARMLNPGRRQNPFLHP